MIAGRYTLEREIGRGGSGTVHLALDEVLGRQVAIKRIGLVPGSDNAERERAEREARLAAAGSMRASQRIAPGTPRTMDTGRRFAGARHEKAREIAGLGVVAIMSP